jgi:hypothetical protein
MRECRAGRFTVKAMEAVKRLEARATYLPIHIIRSIATATAST